MNSKVIIGGLLAALVLGGLVTILRGGALNVPAPQENPQSGNVTSLTNTNGCWENNGVKECAVRLKFFSATTTPMVYKFPNATSTLLVGSGCVFTLASTSQKAARIATAARPNATTTFLFGANITGGAQAAVIATTTTDSFVIAPNNYVALSLVGGSGTDSPTGYCTLRYTY